ncbi:hypothetical protein Cs7R123_33530 [Catellatospora sp. TT07R-123]|uniref:hypothetical protein n=1 Tax=Catellatospora sp. TT07R-123 TaxID=2733863 RepID=UPI001B19906A|nr:hypothetical protein [Catellatospora sp. TT07R-123]GHJ46011.1 hypothetical protein Cs7R123_33530 [Catellatospora sp. TT07R-123]
MSPISTAPAQLTQSDAQLRGQFLREVLQLLYPQCSSTGEPGTRVAEYVVIPDARRPKLLVPLGSRRVAAAAVRRFAEPQSRLAKLKRDAVAVALQSGAWPAVLRDRVRLTSPAGGGDTIDAFLREALGTDVRVSIHIGPARANRKPVLQLISPDGQTIGFAKLGVGPLTRRLVRAETAALSALSHVQLSEVTVPSILHAGQWRGTQVLVQSALPVWQARAALTPARLQRAMTEVAAACGLTQGWLATSPYWADLRNRLCQLEADTAAADRAAPEVAQLSQAARFLVERCSELSLRYGAWHGDWAPWNMANLAGSLLVWDWERFTPGVPLGFDAVHYDLQRQLQDGVDPQTAVESTVRRAPLLLEPFEVVPGSAEVVALLYLADLATRYLSDRQAEAGARLGVLGTWLLPVLIRKVAHL